MANKEISALTAASALDGTEVAHIKQGSNSRKVTTKEIAKFSAKAVMPLGVTDPNASSALTTGDGKTYFRVPAALNGFNLTAVAASVTTVSSSGTPTIQLRRERSGASVDMLSTKITIDANEKDSSTAASAAVIDTTNDDVATADFIHVDVDVAGTGTKGLNVEMTFELP